MEQFEDHKSVIPGQGILVTSWDGSESNFVPFSEMNWHDENPHWAIHVYEDEEMTKRAYIIRCKKGTTKEEAEAEAAVHPKHAVAEWTTVKSLKAS